MSKVVEFYFDVVSPASYLAWTQLPALVEDTGAQIDYRPFFLPGLFKEAGSSSPISVPAKGQWLFHDLRRWAKRYNVPFWMNDHFPLNSITMMRGLHAWRERDEFVDLANGFMDGMWVSNRDLSDPKVLDEVVSEAGIDPDEFVAKVSDPETKQQLVDVTSQLASKGAFGAPTFFIGEEMHWGQDRIDFVREAVMAEA